MAEPTDLVTPWQGGVALPDVVRRSRYQAADLQRNNQQAEYGQQSEAIGHYGEDQGEHVKDDASAGGESDCIIRTQASKTSPLPPAAA